MSEDRIGRGPGGAAEFYEFVPRPDGSRELVINAHPGQGAALASKARVVLVLAGTQSGKTTMGPLWLLNEIAARGPGDYLVVAPSYPLMDRKVVPEFKRLFQETLELGRHYDSAGKSKFVFSDAGIRRLTGRDGPGVVYFGYASRPESLESMTALACWADEAGQSGFPLESYEAIQRRLAVNRGRMLITTTPYTWGWLKSEISDKAGATIWQDDEGAMRREESPSGRPDIEVVRFRSTMNPNFGVDEYLRQEQAMPAWRFRMMYCAEWTRPAGAVYDCFDDQRHVVAPFPIPDDWPRFVGVDFGQVNTAAVFVALDPDTRMAYAYRSYHAGGKTVDQHVATIRHGQPAGLICSGGSPGETDWRNQYRHCGLFVSEPSQSDVEAGIQAVYGLFREGRLRVFSTLRSLLDQIATYSRELDESGNPTERIHKKNQYHLLDALRYSVLELTHLADRQVASVQTLGVAAAPSPQEQRMAALLAAPDAGIRAVEEAMASAKPRRDQVLRRI